VLPIRNTWEGQEESVTDPDKKTALRGTPKRGGTAPRGPRTKEAELGERLRRGKGDAPLQEKGGRPTTDEGSTKKTRGVQEASGKRGKGGEKGGRPQTYPGKRKRRHVRKKGLTLPEKAFCFSLERPRGGVVHTKSEEVR